MALFQKDVNTIPKKPSGCTQTPSLLGMPTNPVTDTNTKDKTDTSPEKNKLESRLIVGPNIKLKGVEIEDYDTLIVEGYVEASLDSRVTEIAETGVYKGTVEIDTAIIKGKFEGELTARERIIVHATGDVSGKIRYGRLAIEEGGRVHGDLDELHLRPGVKQPAIAEAKDTKTSEAAE